MGSQRKMLTLATMVIVGMFAFAPTANGSIIILSDVSSEPSVDGSLLDATLEFVIDITGTALSLTVTNDTLAPNGFNISEIYFNGLDGISLALQGGSPGWTLGTGGAADGFGIYDFFLDVDLTPNNPKFIKPGQSKTFNFIITGGFPLETDFTSLFSTIPPGDTPGVVAAKFIQGPGDASAFGASVPSPGPLALLGVSAIFLGRRRRRRCT